MTRLVSVSAFFFIATSIALLAQDTTGTWSIAGEVRERTELDGRSFDGGAPAPLYHLLRTRLDVAAAPFSHVSALVQIQDSRVFGEENPALADGTFDGSADGLDLHQAYFVVDSIGGVPLRLKVGRQEFAYGDERLIGAVGWHNVGRSFDGAVLAYDGRRIDADLFAAHLNGSTTSGTSKNLLGFYGVVDFDGATHADVFAIGENDTHQLSSGPDAGAIRLLRYTPGARLHGRIGAFDYDVQGAYQGGVQATTDSTARLDIRASMLSASAGYTFQSAARLHIEATYTQLSGDDDPANGTSNTFNTLYATNHKFYGAMDYFPFNATLRPFGLQDAFVTISSAPLSGVSVALAAHLFGTATDVTVGESAATALGEEFDLTGTWKASKPLALQLGVSTFIPGAVVNDLLGDRTTYWGYLMGSVAL